MVCVGPPEIDYHFSGFVSVEGQTVSSDSSPLLMRRTTVVSSADFMMWLLFNLAEQS